MLAIQPGAGYSYKNQRSEAVKGEIAGRRLEILSKLSRPRPGLVDPETCDDCADLLKRLRAAKEDGDEAALRLVMQDMRLHKNLGHPEDKRLPPSGQ